jgi:hypothetical protein
MSGCKLYEHLESLHIDCKRFCKNRSKHQGCGRTRARRRNPPNQGQKSRLSRAPGFAAVSLEAERSAAFQNAVLRTVTVRRLRRQIHDYFRSGAMSGAFCSLRTSSNISRAGCAKYLAANAIAGALLDISESQRPPPIPRSRGDPEGGTRGGFRSKTKPHRDEVKANYRRRAPCKRLRQAVERQIRLRPL